MKRLFATIGLFLVLVSPSFAQTVLGPSLFQGGGFYGQTLNLGPSGATLALNFANTLSNQWSTTTAITAITVVNPPQPGAYVVLSQLNNATGGYAITWPANFVCGPNGSPCPTDLMEQQPSKTSYSLWFYDGTNYNLVSAPQDLAAGSCYGRTQLSSSTATVTNKCCAATTDIFVCNDETTHTTFACNVFCAGSNAITLLGAGASDFIDWAKIR